MTEEETADLRAAVAARDRGTALGVVLTGLVLVMGGTWLWLGPGARGSLLALTPVELASFVAAVAGPIAALWFVLAVLQQGRQLRLQRAELDLQRAELARQRRAGERIAELVGEQTEVLRETRGLTRRESFLRLLDLYERKLALEAAQISSLTAIDRAATERHQAAWRDYERGERNALFRHLIGQLAEGGHDDFLRRVDRVASGRGLLERFSATAAEIVGEAVAVDERLAALCRSSEWAYLADLLDGVRATSQGRS